MSISKKVKKYQPTKNEIKISYLCENIGTECFQSLLTLHAIYSDFELMNTN